MCKKNCATCGGYKCEEDCDKTCFKGIDLNSVKDECFEWFPIECPITGMTYSGLVCEDNGTKTPVYSFSPYTSYSLPEYDTEEKAFYRKVYDEDEGYWSEECQHFADLEELEEEMPKDELEKVKAFYNIKN
jgi:hypothetical protein